MQDVKDVIGDYTGNARKVLEYSLVMKHLVDEAKQPGFTTANWAPLRELIAVEEFERVGNFMEVMTWPIYVEALTKWAVSADWECSFKRISEIDGRVFLELEERGNAEGYSSVVNSCTVYEFNKAGKLRHLDIYLQMPPPAGAASPF